MIETNQISTERIVLLANILIEIIDSGSKVAQDAESIN